MSKVKWVSIKTWEGIYEVSNTGLVKTVGNVVYGGHRKKQIIFVPEKIRTHSHTNNGYYVIRLCKRPRMKSYLVHRLVAEHFIRNIHNKPEVNHKDGDKKNNFVNNLEWVTKKENVIHAFETGIKTNKLIKRKPLSKKKVIEIFKSKLSLKVLSEKYNVPKLTIQSIKTGKRRFNITGAKYSGVKY